MTSIDKSLHDSSAANRFAALEKYLHDHIPLSKAMQVSVLDASDGGVTLAAPLAPNINHRETVFGGSASAVAILAAWSLLHTRLANSGLSCRLVIQHNTMDYELPIAGDFTARSTTVRLKLEQIQLVSGFELPDANGVGLQGA